MITGAFPFAGSRVRSVEGVAERCHVGCMFRNAVSPHQYKVMHSGGSLVGRNGWVPWRYLVRKEDATTKGALKTCAALKIVLRCVECLEDDRSSGAVCDSGGPNCKPRWKRTKCKVKYLFFRSNCMYQPLNRRLCMSCILGA